MEIKIMKKSILALLILTVSIIAATRPVKVVGDRVIPLPERLANKATHMVELSDIQYNTYTSPRYFKLVDGTPVAKTQVEVDAEELQAKKDQASKLARKLADELKSTPNIDESGEVYQFNQLSQTLFLAQYMNNDVDIRVKRKGKKSEKMNKAKAGLIFSKLSSLHNSIEDALEADLDAIELEDYSMSNLTTIEATQKGLE
jgi:hypothetical protein